MYETGHYLVLTCGNQLNYHYFPALTLFSGGEATEKNRQRDAQFDSLEVCTTAAIMSSTQHISC